MSRRGSRRERDSRISSTGSHYPRDEDGNSHLGTPLIPWANIAGDVIVTGDIITDGGCAADVSFYWAATLNPPTVPNPARPSAQALGSNRE